MWRRFGEKTYAVLTLGIFTVQAVALVLLTWAFTFDRLNIGPQGFVMRDALALAVAVTAMAVMVLTAYMLAYHSISAGRLQLERHETEVWRQRWIRVLFKGEALPQGRLGTSAIEALVDVREKLTGNEAAVLDRVIEAEGISRHLIAIATTPRRYSLASRLDALDLLARAGASSGFDPLSGLVGDPEMAVRVMAVRAISRAAASFDGSEARGEAARTLVHLLDHANVPAGAVEEAFLVLGPTAPDVLRVTLETSDRPGLVTAALDAAGRLHCVELIDEISTHLHSRDAEVRCAAWRAVDGVGILPLNAGIKLDAGMVDTAPHVRAQAARAARLLPEPDGARRLVRLLTDPSWWVRRAAARSLVQLGDVGVSALKDAGEHHRDRFARHISLEVLVEMRQLRPQRGMALRSAA